MNLSYKQLTLNESLEIIESNNYCHMGLSKNNKPYIVPMNYNSYKEKDCYYIELLSSRKCKKMEIINDNNFINICIEEVLDNSFFSVMCYGRVVNVCPYNDYIVKIIIKLDYVSGRIISKTIK